MIRCKNLRSVNSDYITRRETHSFWVQKWTQLIIIPVPLARLTKMPVQCVRKWSIQRIPRKEHLLFSCCSISLVPIVKAAVERHLLMMTPMRIRRQKLRFLGLRSNDAFRPNRFPTLIACWSLQFSCETTIFAEVRLNQQRFELTHSWVITWCVNPYNNEHP